MLSTTVVNIISYFYPIGNTPAVSLIQDIPPGRDADILLLGCGDVRNILFTTFCNNGPLSRHLDITCCDLEPAVLARNILLLTLIVDDTTGKDTTSHWQIYYHLFLDKNSSNMLDAQSEKLVLLSETRQAWSNGPYGNLMKFHDTGTLAKLRDVWKSYCISKLTPTERSTFNSMFEEAVKKSLDYRTQRVGKGVVLTSLRSAAPATFHALADIVKLEDHFWMHGSTDKRPATKSQDRIPNRMFASSSTASLTIHYGIDPLLGFPLATAYIATIPETKSSTQNKAIEVARGHFRDWSESFRSQAGKHLSLRMFAGDAVAFCHSLQHRRSVKHGPSNWCRSSYVMEPLTLDEYNLGPLSFDIIDSSNLVDHLGTLNVLMAAPPLLKENVLATLYTESLVAQEKDREALRAQMLCGHFPTMSMILGLIPIEYWTNASAVSTVEENMMDFVSAKAESDTGKTQMFCRIGWKLNVPILSGGGVPRIHFKSSDLAAIVYDTYQNMFQHQNLGRLLSGLSLRNFTANPSHLSYNRSTLVGILKVLKTRVVVNWSEFVKELVSRIENDRTILFSSNYVQELYVQLELQGLYTLPGLAQQILRSTLMDGIGAWSKKPLVACITLLVPRGSLSTFTNQSHLQLGTPLLQATVTSKSGFMTGRCNIFSDLQLAFGNIATTGERANSGFSISIEDDPLGWLGSSPLLVSFFVPTVSIMLEPDNCYISLAVQQSPMNSPALVSQLGIELDVFQARLRDNNHVFVTQYAPCLNGYRFVGPSSPTNTGLGNAGAADVFSISANVDGAMPKIATLQGRIDFSTGPIKKSLLNGAPVALRQDSPYIITVNVGAAHYNLNFPCPVNASASKTRIARKSAYIEVIVPMADPVTGDGFPRYMFSTLPTSNGPIILNMPYLRIGSLPILNTSKKINLEWLNPHVSLQMSARERYLRGGMIVTGTAINADVRVNYKESLFSMFMSLTGLQGGHGNYFVLNKPDDGGGQIIIIVSSLRLDLANHTVVLDCAIIPLTFKSMRALDPFLAATTLPGFGPILRTIVDHEELKLWKEVLPSQIERCRTWEHKSSCEYQTATKIPLSLEDGEAFYCSCGVGQFPDKFLTNVSRWDLAQRFATRAAISPCFSVPYVEPIFNPGFGAADLRGNSMSKCIVCKKDKGSSGKALLFCSRCKVARYCSKECQTSDWREHRKVCKSQV